MALSSTSTQDYILFPGEEKWELWENAPASGSSAAVRISGRQPVLRGESAAAISSNVSKGALLTVALPSFYVNTLSVLLPAASKSELGHAAAFEAEMLGLFEGRTADEAIWDWRQLPGHVTIPGSKGEKEESGQDSRMLLTACALPRQLPSVLEIVGAHRFLPSFDFFDYSDDSLVIWKELGRLVAVATRKAKVIYSQTLSDDRLNTASLQELRCIYFQLEASQLVGEKITIELRGTFLPGEVDDLQRFLALPVTIHVRNAPRIPVQGFELKPSNVTLQQIAARKQRLRVRTALAVAALLSVGMCVWVYWLLCLEQELKSLKEQVALVEPKAAVARATAEKWDGLDLLLDAHLSPLYTLQNVVKCMPQKDIRLVLFDQTGRNLMLRGEANASADWAPFTVSLKAHAPFKDVTWSTPSPTFDGQSKAMFEVTGTLNYAPVN